MASRTRWAVTGLTAELLFRVRDTVATDTPACRATCSMFTTGPTSLIRKM